MRELTIVLPPGAQCILAAVSGGADSVALLALLKEAVRGTSVRLTAAHFEHGIRGRSSLEDAAFVRELCGRWDVPLYEGQGDVPRLAKERSMGLEEAAREARYAFLRETRISVGAQWIALAHHRDDQAETVLMHILRGSGLKGLTGMRELEGDLYRPLLRASKEDLISFLRENSIPWREDETNLQADNPRNGLRLCVLPEAERFYPGAREALCRLAEIAAREDDFLFDETERYLSQCSVRLPGGWALMTSVHPAILARAVRRLLPLGEDSVKRVLALRRGAMELPGFYRAEKCERFLYIYRRGEGRFAGFKERHLPEEGAVGLDDLGTLLVSRGAGRPVRDDPMTQELDADALKGAVIRTRRPGDFIDPLGAAGRKKLSDYFIDRHVDRPIRDCIPLIARGNEICWVMGVGISERVKLKEGSAPLRLKWVNEAMRRLMMEGREHA